MIFVTVGTHTQAFNRLVESSDKLANVIDDEVVIQLGHSTYIPKFAQYFRWIDGKGFEELIRESFIVISQSSAGTILQTLSFHKPMIIVPRLKKYGEHFNDHQKQLANALASRGISIVLYEPSLSNLQNAIKNISSLSLSSHNQIILINSIKHQLEIWEKCL